MALKGRYEIRLSGSGGQGVILASVIVGEAAALKEGLYAVQTQSYGPEARGGYSKAEVVVSDSPIDYPKCVRPDISVILTQDAYDKYGLDVKDGGLVVVDNFYVRELRGSSSVRTYSLPIVRVARDELGREIVTNIVSIGALALFLEKEGVMSVSSLRESVLENVPKGTEELNLRAFERGVEIASSVL